MVKKAIALGLILTLFALNALAAPVRPAVGMAAEYPGLVAQVQGLADVAAAAVLDSGLKTLPEGTAPDVAFAEALVRRALQGELLAFQQQGEALSLGSDQAREAAAEFLAVPPVAGMAAVTMDMSGEPGGVGAHIFDLALGEEGLTVLADVYALNGFEGSAADAPEESLTWLAAMRFSFIPRMESAAGFALSGFETLHEYTSRGWVKHEGKGLFEVMAPEGFAPLAQGTALLSLTDGRAATLTVSGESASVSALAAQWGVSPDAQGRSVYREAGLLRIAVSAGSSGGSLVLEMRYPTDMEQEFSLYSLTVENSFIVYGSAIG